MNLTKPRNYAGFTVTDSFIIQGNVLLHDHSQLLPLSNGLTVDIQIQSALSLDLSGAVSISLWNRQSSSLVRNR